MSSIRDCSAGGPCAWLAWAVPLAFAIGSITGHGAWQDDRAVLRDIGLWRIGTEGAVSSVLAQAITLLPLGGLSFRLSLPGALALAAASRLFFEALADVLDGRARAPINGVLALLATCLWALTPAVQAEARHVGGALPALALLLLGMRQASVAFGRASAPRAQAASGLAGGALLAEQHAAGALLVLFWIALTVERRRRPSRSPTRLLVACGGSFALLGSLRAIAPLLPGLPAAALASSEASPAWLDRVHAAVAGVAELGGTALLACGAGALLGACVPALRRALWPWALCAAFAALAAAILPGATCFARALALLSSAAFFPVALHALLRWLWAYPLPLARPAALLAMTFATTLLLVHADRAAQELQPPPGAAAWTDEALVRLPPNAMVLLDSPALAERLLAERLLRGTRSDVIAVPRALLSTELLGRHRALLDPALAPLSRQLWVNGKVDEHSLACVADARPVFVEPQPGWERALLEHTRPDGLWLAFAPHALGRAERRAGVRRSRAALRRALEQSGGQGGADARTRRALADAAHGQALVLAALGERQPAARLARAARAIDRGEAPARESTRDPAHGRVAVGERSR